MSREIGGLPDNVEPDSSSSPASVGLSNKYVNSDTPEITGGRFVPGRTLMVNDGSDELEFESLTEMITGPCNPTSQGT